MKAQAGQAGATTEKARQDNKQVTHETYDAKNNCKIDYYCSHYSLMNIDYFKYKVMNRIF